jgi:hypothetical protein
MLCPGCAAVPGLWPVQPRSGERSYIIHSGEFYHVLPRFGERSYVETTDSIPLESE